MNRLVSQSRSRKSIIPGYDYTTVNGRDLGSTSYRWKDIHFGGNISGSSATTGSFGYGIISDKLEVTDAIYASFGTNAVPTTGRSSFEGQTDFYNGTNVRGFIYAGAGGIQFGTYGGTDTDIDFAINNSNRMGLTNTSLNFVDNVNISGSSTSTGSFGQVATNTIAPQGSALTVKEVISLHPSTTNNSIGISAVGAGSGDYYVDYYNYQGGDAYIKLRTARS